MRGPWILLWTPILIFGCGGGANPPELAPSPAEVPSEAAAPSSPAGNLAVLETPVSFSVVEGSIQDDPRIEAIVAPFRARMGAEIQQVIGEATGMLSKAVPEGTLGNFSTDAMLWAANARIPKPAHMALTNNGGLRVPIGPGPITIGQMYELMPFENMLSVLVLTGSQLQALCDQLAERRGEPIAGFSFRIEVEGGDRVARDIMVGGPFQGLGGAARRATLIRKIRAEHPDVLLLDSGDIFQGTPYFNFFRGELEFEAMSAMNYQVATIGNHDFDNGVGGLVEMMPHASFDFVSANYDVSGSPLEPYVRPWVIREVGGVKVGIFGLGISFEGLVLASLHEGIRHTETVAAGGRQTVVNQVGWGGMRLGRIDVVLGPGGDAALRTGASHSPKAWAWSSYPVDADLD